MTSARRFVGTTFVVLGLAMAMAFLMLPVASAKALAHWAVLGGCLTIMGAIVWMNTGPAEGEQ